MCMRAPICFPLRPTAASIRRSRLSHPTALDGWIQQLRDARFHAGVTCPHCGSQHCIRWGGFAGRQRYRCRGCARTFSDLTGTPAYYSKKLGAWQAYGAHFRAGLTIRDSAQRLGIHPSTAFRWRHAVLGWLREADSNRIGPWVELGVAWFPWSEKGQRNLRRAPRRRRLDEMTANTRDGVTVLLACDRAGAVISAVNGPAFGLRITRRDLVQCLDGRLGRSPILAASDGVLSDVALYARAQGGTFVTPRRTFDPLVHLRTVHAYRMRLYGWMRRFHGVATRYLPNYLQWHRMVDEPIRNDPAIVAMRWPLDSGFG